MKISLSVPSPRRAWICLALLGLAAVGAAQSVERSELELGQRALTRARYGVSAWPRAAARDGLARELALPGWNAGELQNQDGLLTRPYTHAPSAALRPGAARAPSFVLETRVADSVEGAEEQLVDWLAGLQSPEPAPSAAEVGLTLGDAAFVGRSGAGATTLSWVAFVRGNVAVRVSACDPVREPTLDLGALAQAVDQAVNAAPRLAAGVLPRRPAITAFALPRASAQAGEVLEIELAVEDPARGEPHLGWLVAGGQGYVERGRDGRWRLHTTGPGALTLRLEVTGSTGTSARRELALDVRDD